MSEHEAQDSYPERLAHQAEKVIDTADSGAVLIADAILAHSAAVHRLAAAVEKAAPDRFLTDTEGVSVPAYDPPQRQGG